MELDEEKSNLAVIFIIVMFVLLFCYQHNIPARNSFFTTDLFSFFIFIFLPLLFRVVLFILLFHVSFIIFTFTCMDESMEYVYYCRIKIGFSWKYVGRIQISHKINNKNFLSTQQL